MPSVSQRPRFGELVLRFPGFVVLGWLLAAGFLLAPALRAGRSLVGNPRIAGSESERVKEILEQRFESPFSDVAVVVVTGVPPPTVSDGRALLREVVASVREAPGVRQTLSYLDANDVVFAGETGDGAIVLLGLGPDPGPLEATVREIRTCLRSEAARLRERYPGVALRLTGEGPLLHDLARASAEDTRKAEALALPLTLILLLLTFGSAVAAMLPLLVAVLTVVIALGTAVLLTRVYPFVHLLQNVVSLLGLALGIDYALLAVSRFREALGAGATSREAASISMRFAGRTLTLAGVTCFIGFGALLVVPLREFRSVAVGGLLVVTAAVLLATTLIPALLAWLGRGVDRLRVRRSPPGYRIAAWWWTWGRRVTAHPLLVLLLAGAPMVLLASQVTRLEAGIPRGSWLPAGMEAAEAMRDLEAMERGGLLQSVRLILELPEGDRIPTAEGWEAVRRLGRAVDRDPRIARIHSVATVADGLAPNAPPGAVWRLLPRNLRRAVVSTDGRAVLVEAVPRESEPARLVGLVHDLRELDASSVTGCEGARILVGGLPAATADYVGTTARFSWPVILLVLGSTFVALFVGFRSLLIPLKAVVLNLLTVAAASGAAVLVFQDGYGAGLLGIDGPLDAIYPTVPLLVFCIVFGLSMDYEVFLVARIAEARRGGLGEAESIVVGVARTGRLITSAAAIMIVIFAAFMFGRYLPVKMLGFSLTVAVLLDATVVRLAVGPALLRLAGRWNWWPGDTLLRRGVRGGRS